MGKSPFYRIYSSYEIYTIDTNSPETFRRDWNGYNTSMCV